MIEYRCYTKNVGIIMADDVILKELRLGDIMLTKDGCRYKVIERELYQIDETLIRCNLTVKKVGCYKIER